MLAVWWGLLLGCLCGCATRRQTLEPSVVERIPLGAPKSEVEKVLGPPGTSVTDNSGRLIAYYSHEYRGGRAESPRRSHLRILTLRYNSNEHVERKLLHEAELRFVERRANGVGGLAMNREDILSSIHVGDSRRMVVAALGNPTVEVLELDGGSLMGWVEARRRSPLFATTRFHDSSLLVRLDDVGRVVDFGIGAHSRVSHPEDGLKE
jgi:hypothetical protein